MPTKRTTSQHSPELVAAEPRTTEKGSAAATSRQPPGAEEWPSFFEASDMTRTHEMIVEAVTEMLTSGGFIRAAMAHHHRRFFGRDVNEGVKTFIQSDFLRWKTDLMITWRKNERPDRAYFPKSITDRIRANFREALKGNFESFMARSSPEEQRFLYGVLSNWDGRSMVPENGHNEIYLGHAFESELNRDDLCYLRVPESMIERVEKYADALRAIEDKQEER
jgi:hypothetical protein